uniref:Reticulocalbin-3 n=1 Tax=Echinococcus granulosus TaxID=6210 RepID=A0A068WCM4_ECHGR|nr:ef hand family protein [Echinococcus granulosus]
MKCLILTLLIPLLFAQAKPHPERRVLNTTITKIILSYTTFSLITKHSLAKSWRLNSTSLLIRNHRNALRKCLNCVLIVKFSQIFKKIDQDGDNAIAETELKRWISFVSKTALRADANRHWKNLNANKNEPLAWRDYLERTYGVEDEISSDPERQAQYIKMKRDDERRWNAADMNFDNKLSLDEYSAFLHPQDYPRMRNVVIEETLGSVDTDHDGYISIEEYLVDLAKSYGRPFDPKAPLDDWGQKEKEQFLKHRDRNGDKRLDRQEIGEWIMPTDYDPVEAETKHLIYHADDNKDGKLQEKEVLEHHSLFVGSQALNYGRPLGHEEL